MIEEQRRKILLEAIKQVATDKRCPKWAEEILMKAVITAKKLADDNAPKVEFIDAPVAEGVRCMNVDPKDKKVYEVLDYVTMIQGVKLWNVKILQGDNKVPTGTILHNVPDTNLRVIK